MSVYNLRHYSLAALDELGQLMRPIFDTELSGEVINMSDQSLTYVIESAKFDRDAFYTLIDSGIVVPGGKITIGPTSSHRLDPTEINDVIRFRLVGTLHSEGLRLNLTQEEGKMLDQSADFTSCLFQCEFGCETSCEVLCQTGDEVTNEHNSTGGDTGRVYLTDIVGSSVLNDVYGSLSSVLPRYKGMYVVAQDGPVGGNWTAILRINGVDQAGYEITLPADSQPVGEDQVASILWSTPISVNPGDIVDIKVTSIGVGDPGSNIEIYLIY